MLYAEAGLFVAGQSAWLVAFGLQLGGLGGAAGTLAAVVVSLVCATAYTILATERILSWSSTTRYPVLVAHALALSSHVLMTLSSQGLYAWIGERYPGAFVTPTGGSTGLIDYFIYAVDVTSATGYGFVLPDALAIKILFMFDLYFVFYMFYLLMFPALVAVILESQKRRKHRKTSPKPAQYSVY